MKRITKIKDLFPAPKDGKDAVLYEIVPSVGAINADNKGNVTTGVVLLKIYKTEGESREDITPGMTAVGGKSAYRAQYSADGGTWTNCVHVSSGPGVAMVLGYGIPGAAVATVKSTLGIRLQKLQDESYTTVYQMTPIQVVKNGAQGARGRWYYFDGYFVSTKEYQATDAKGPYVALDWEETVTQNGVTTKVTRTSYYMLVASTNKASDDTLIAPRTQAAAGIWELMEDNFKYMITEAIFSTFAKLGSAVFNGDWMISQYGNGGTNHNYQLFRSFDEVGWRPNIGIDFKSGEIYAGNGKVHFAKDGSGQLAGGNIDWDEGGNVSIAGFRRNKMQHITQTNFSQVMIVNEIGNYEPQFEKLGTLVSVEYLPEDVIMLVPSDYESIRKYNGEEFILYNKSGKHFSLTGSIVTDETSTSTNSYPIPTNSFCVLRACLRAINGEENACWIKKSIGQIK